MTSGQWKYLQAGKETGTELFRTVIFPASQLLSPRPPMPFMQLKTVHHAAVPWAGHISLTSLLHTFSSILCLLDDVQMLFINDDEIMQYSGWREATIDERRQGGRIPSAQDIKSPSFFSEPEELQDKMPVHAPQYAPEHSIILSESMEEAFASLIQIKMEFTNVHGYVRATELGEKYCYTGIPRVGRYL